MLALGTGKTMHKYIIIYLLIISFPSVAQEKTLDQLEQEKLLNQSVSVIDQFQAKVDLYIKTREINCTKAIGYKPFCTCIMEKLPMAWSFSDYITITTQSKEANGYNKMNAELKEAYDKVPKIRDECVQEINR